jgi:cytochrome c oxidase subunit II
MFSLFNQILNFDAPLPWGMYFQDTASPQMEGLVELHDNIMFILVLVLIIVGWVLFSITWNFAETKSPISHKYLNHGTLIEILWTIAPGLVVIFISIPSYKLLYLMDEVFDATMSIIVEAHQWYWSYQYPDFLDSDGELIEFDSYIVPESDLEDGGLRMLEVDNRLVLPIDTHIRFIVSSQDVIHSFASPSLGVKIDAYPGRLNQSSTYINREGVYYGQCSEICGILHSSMPIVIECVGLEDFLNFLSEA